MTGPVHAHPEVAALAVPVDQLRPHPRNPNKGDVAAITESVIRNGQYRPIVYQRSTGHILAGNHTWLAVQQAGETTVAAVGVDVSDEQALRILLADNRTAQLAAYDEAALAEVLQSLDGDYDGTGWNPVDVDDLLHSLRPPDLDEVAERTDPPAADANWPTVEIKCPRHVAAAWTSHVNEHGPEPAKAFALLLGVDPTWDEPPPGESW